MQYLFTRRRRYVGPHRLVEALLPLLHEVVELLDAIAAATGDDRWEEAVERLQASRQALAAPSARERALLERCREEERVQQAIAEQRVTRVERGPPRKPQARVITHRPFVVAAKRARRR